MFVSFINNKIKSVVILSKVIKIGRDAFRNNEITEVVLSVGLETIGGNSFEGNQ